MAESAEGGGKGRLPSNRDIQIYTAGTVTLPPEYPDVGILSLAQTGQGDAVLTVEQRATSAQLNRYLVQRDDVRAIRLAREGKLDPKTDLWLFGRAARTGALEPSTDGNIYGVVYVQESVGVVWQLERALSAGELCSFGCPCEDRDGCEG